MKTYNSIHDINDREEVKLIPYENLDGFYKHPTLPLALNKEGLVYNILTNNFIKALTDPDGRQRIQYQNYKNGKRLHFNKRLHRLLAVIFIGRPKIHCDKPFNKLEVNHIDGNNGNNSLGNLEWCTGKENTNHYFDYGQDTSSKALFSKNIKTGEIRYHRSTSQAAIDLDIGGAALIRYIRENRHLKYHYHGYIFSLTKDGFIDLDKKHKGAIEDCIVIDLYFDMKYIFGSIKEGADFINMEYKLLWYHLKKRRKYIKDNFLITRLYHYIEDNS